MRADRLLSIVLLLQNHRRMTARELSEALEVSERTIFRDMEALSAAGIPVYAERGSGGGWVLPEGYNSHLTGLRTRDIQALLLARESGMLTDLGWREAFNSALVKLLGALPPTLRSDADVTRERIHIDGAGWHRSTETFPCLPVIQEAVWEEKKLLIQYPREETMVERTVNPLGLIAKGSIWYLAAETEDGMRTFRISRIQSPRMLEEPFIRPEAFDLAEYWNQSTTAFKAALPTYPARIKARSQLLSRIRSERFVRITEELSSDEPEWTELKVDLQTYEYACGWILGFGPQMEVLEPQELRKEIQTLAREIISLYK